MTATENKISPPKRLVETDPPEAQKEMELFPKSSPMTRNNPICSCYSYLLSPGRNSSLHRTTLLAVFRSRSVSWGQL